jgi:hypothetical protein
VSCEYGAKVSDSSAGHSLNAPSPRIVTELGIENRESGSVIVLSELQPVKQFSPMNSSDFDTSITSIDEQHRNA